MSRQWLRVRELGIALTPAGCASAPLKPTVKAQGFAAGLVEAGRGWSVEPVTLPACPPALAETTVSAEDDIEREGTK